MIPQPKFNVGDKVWALLKMSNEPYWLTQEAREIISISISIMKNKTSITYKFSTAQCDESRVFSTKRDAEAAQHIKRRIINGQQ